MFRYSESNQEITNRKRRCEKANKSWPQKNRGIKRNETTNRKESKNFTENNHFKENGFIMSTVWKFL